MKVSSFDLEKHLLVQGLAIRPVEAAIRIGALFLVISRAPLGLYRSREACGWSSANEVLTSLVGIFSQPHLSAVDSSGPLILTL